MIKINEGKFLAPLSLALVFLMGTLGACGKHPGGASAAPSIALEWDANKLGDGSIDPSVSGYRVYYGTATRDYTNSVDVGSVITTRINNLQKTTMFFAVTAYNAEGLESEFSNEVSSNLAIQQLSQNKSLKISQ